MKQARRSFSSQFKVERVLEVLSGIKTQAEVCREHQLQPHLFASWKSTFLERAPSLFETDEHRSGDEARVAELERLVGRQAVEIEALKKASSILASARRRSER
jgi:transposase